MEHGSDFNFCLELSVVMKSKVGVENKNCIQTLNNFRRSFLRSMHRLIGLPLMNNNSCCIMYNLKINVSKKGKLLYLFHPPNKNLFQLFSIEPK